MKTVGKIIWRLYLAFMAVLLLGFAVSFLGTPWGYLDFYIRANRHLDRFFGEGAKVTWVEYDFKMKSYSASATCTTYPEDSFAVREWGDEDIMINFYHTVLWEAELTSRYHSAYPEFALDFDFPQWAAAPASFTTADRIPSIFEYEHACHYLQEIRITTPADAASERLFALVVELDFAFPQTNITLYDGSDYHHLRWLDRAPREDYNVFLELLAENLSH